MVECGLTVTSDCGCACRMGEGVPICLERWGEEGTDPGEVVYRY
jgi:hypothetical protein